MLIHLVLSSIGVEVDFMGKIYIKTRHSDGMIIPHNWNFANAMYGFRELGAEIIPYEHISEIYDAFTEHDIAIDYIDQCNRLFKKFDVIPYLSDYPDALSSYLGRRIWKDTINSISCDESKWKAGNFVKPVKNKVFTGKVISSISDLVGCGNCTEDYEVFVSEPINILGEWRCFIYYDEIMDIRPYGALIGKESYLHHYDTNIVKKMIESFKQMDGRPNACSMDICLTDSGDTLLLEMNDAYSLGCYGLDDINYAKFISARWSQLLNVTDPYHF